MFITAKHIGRACPKACMPSTGPILQISRRQTLAGHVLHLVCEGFQKVKVAVGVYGVLTFCLEIIILVDQIFFRKQKTRPHRQPVYHPESIRQKRMRAEMLIFMVFDYSYAKSQEDLLVCILQTCRSGTIARAFPITNIMTEIP